MLTREQIRDELAEIQIYYRWKNDFDSAPKEIRAERIYETLEKYNAVMRRAPAKLYLLYLGLYIQDRTQSALADEWGYTKDYIKSSNLGLVEYIENTINSFPGAQM